MKGINRIVGQSSGFTLIEVLVALAICAIAGIAALKVANEQLNAVSILEEQTVASWVAENRLAELLLAKKWPIQNNQRGKEQQLGVEWYWLVQVKKTELLSDFVEVTVTVFKDEDRKQEIYSLSTYMTKETE